MPEAVYRTMQLLWSLVAGCPLGTNLGLLHLLWMLVSGRLLAARGAVVPGLAACGLSDRAVRRAWAALGQGGWASGPLLARWAAAVAAEGRWQPQAHGGYRPVAVDVTGFWRPRLRGCPTAHYHSAAGPAPPAGPPRGVPGRGRGGGPRLGGAPALVRGGGPRPPPRPPPRPVGGGGGGAPPPPAGAPTGAGGWGGGGGGAGRRGGWCGRAAWGWRCPRRGAGRVMWGAGQRPPPPAVPAPRRMAARAARRPAGPRCGR